MGKLTTEQLADLTKRINARLLEFGDKIFDELSAGVVRLAHDEIVEWWNEEETQPVEAIVPIYAPPAPTAAAIEQGKAFYRELEARRITEETERETKPKTVTVKSEDGEVWVRDEPPANGNGRAPTHLAPVALSRHATATLGPEHTVVTPLKDSHLPTLDQLIAEVKRQSMAGVMPTMSAFDMAKPATWATAQAHLLRLGVTWTELAEKAGLQLKRAKP